LTTIVEPDCSLAFRFIWWSIGPQLLAQAWVVPQSPAGSR